MILRLEAFARLSPDDRLGIGRLTRQSTRDVRARRDLIREGDRPRSAFIVIDGWACCYKTLPDGRRQIVGLFIPGDMSDRDSAIFRRMDHSVAAITRLRVAEFSNEDLEGLILAHPGLREALWWDALVTTAIQREWALNLGKRSAYERVAHLLLELYRRLECVGLTSGHSCHLPLTQADIGDATGLTPVHTNRTIQRLRQAGLIDLQPKSLAILDMEGLESAALFSDNYLHFDREERIAVRRAS